MRVHLEPRMFCLNHKVALVEDRGLKFIQDITSFGAANGTVLIPFEFSTTQTFMIAAIGFNTQTTIRFVFYQNQQVIDNINNGGVPYLDFNVGALTEV